MSQESEDAEKVTSVRFNLTYTTAVVAFLTQFGGGVWFMSGLSNQVEQLKVKLVAMEVRQDKVEEKTTPMFYQFISISDTLAEVKADLKEIKANTRSGRMITK